MRSSIIGGGPSAVGVGVGGHYVVSAVLAGCEDDIDIGGCVLEVLLAQVGVGRQLLHGGGVVLVLLPT